MKKGALTAAILFILVVSMLGAVLLYSGVSSATGAVPIDKVTICHMPGQQTMTLPLKAADAHFHKHASGESDFTGPCCPENRDCQKSCDGEKCTDQCDSNFACRDADNGARCCFPEASPTPSPSPTGTSAPTLTPTTSPTDTLVPTSTPTTSPTSTPVPTGSPSPSPSQTPSGSPSPSP